MRRARAQSSTVTGNVLMQKAASRKGVKVGSIPWAIAIVLKYVTSMKKKKGKRRKNYNSQNDKIALPINGLYAS